MYSDEPVFISSRHWANDDDIDFVMGHNPTLPFTDVEGHKFFIKLHEDEKLLYNVKHGTSYFYIFTCKTAK